MVVNERYNRQEILPMIGKEGQDRLKEAFAHHEDSLRDIQLLNMVGTFNFSMVQK